MESHTLSPEEVEMITSILDAEERNLDNMQQNGTSLSALDAQCREIWPNWDSAPQRFTPSRYNTSNFQRQRSMPIFDDRINNRQSLSAKKSTISNISPSRTGYSPKKTSPSPNHDVAKYEFESMKGDIDDLYNRIQLMSSGSGSPSPTRQQNVQERSQQSPTRVSPDSPKSYVSSRMTEIPQQKLHSTPRRMEYESNTGISSNDSDDIHQIKRENAMLRAQLEKVQKLLEIEQEQNKKLEAALKRPSRNSGK